MNCGWASVIEAQYHELWFVFASGPDGYRCRMRARRESRILESLASNLVRIRIRRGLSQEQLAEAADLTPRYVQDVERARSDPALTVFLALADALDVAPAILLRPGKLLAARSGRPSRRPAKPRT